MDDMIYVLELYSEGVCCASTDKMKLRDKLLRFYFKNTVPYILDRYKGKEGDYTEEILADINSAINENYIDEVGWIYQTELI